MVEEGLLHEGEPKEEAVDISGTFWTHGPATSTPNVKAITEDDDMMEFFRGLLGENPLAYDMKVCRAKAESGFTAFHVGPIFQNRGTYDVYTVCAPRKSTWTRTPSSGSSLRTHST